MLKQIKKIFKYLFHPKKLLVVLMNLNWFNFLSDTSYLKLKYKLIMGKKLNLDNPQTYNEKLQWLKLHDRKDIYTTMVDKYEVKKYVADIIGEEYIIPTLGIYDNFDDIDFDKLPNQFVIKCTHDSGGNIICNDKSKLDIQAAKKKINKFLKRKYYYVHREWPYKNVKPRILIEKYIVDKNGVLNDFKLVIFNGKIAYSLVCTERNTGNVKFTFYDNKKNFIPVTQSGAQNDPKNAKLPKNYEKFVELTKKIAKNLTEARIDFYDVDGKIYFGEITFSATAGFGKFEPEIWDYKIGEMLDLSTVKSDEKQKNN